MERHDAAIAHILELCCKKNISVNKLAAIGGAARSTADNMVSAAVNAIQRLCGGLSIGIEGFFRSPLFWGLSREIK